jgi:hypothetical protein
MDIKDLCKNGVWNDELLNLLIKSAENMTTKDSLTVVLRYNDVNRIIKN